MKVKIILIAVGIMFMAGCKSKQLAAVDEPNFERTIIEKQTDLALNVDNQTGIMALEERFTFTREEDKTIHDARQFFVIIGSFRNKQNAENYKESLRVKGFNPVILLSETGLHRVSVDSFGQESDARSRIIQIRSQFTEHADTWLLIRK